MKKYFVVSDIHGFYDEFMTALKEKNFDLNNPDHILIVIGDIFDRGSQAVKVYNFLREFPKNRKILIRGNHEFALKNMIVRKAPKSYDFSNGTVDTVYGQFIDGQNLYTYDYRSCFQAFLKLDVLQWIFSNDWVNYYELGRYIFVHSYIPMDMRPYTEIYGLTIDEYKEFKNLPDWKEAAESQWEQATWGCPWLYIVAGQYIPDKTIVCGHWHTSDFYINLDDKPCSIYQNPIYYSDHIIALDACTALSGRVNVLVLDEQYNIIK